MRKTAILLPIVLIATLLLPCCKSSKQGKSTAGSGEEQPQYIVGAFIWGGNSVDMAIESRCFTHLNYAYGDISASGDSLVIPTPELFRRCLDLRHDNPGLKVLLTLQANEKKFSATSADAAKRAAFVRSIKHAVDIYNLDGIDIDWEFPTRTIDEDSTNYVALVRELRQAIGGDKIISIDGSATGKGMIFSQLLPLVDYFNVMAYDLGAAPHHHTALYRSEHTSWMSVDEAVKNYERRGVPHSKIVLGMGFYGRGDDTAYKGWTDFKDTRVLPGMTERWDSVACVPYITDADGVIKLSYENQRSIAIKCEYIKANRFRGGMYWRYANDDSVGTLRHTVASHLLSLYRK